MAVGYGEAAVILFFYVTMLLTFARRKTILGEFLMGILFGFGWELLTLNFWDYNMPLILFEDVSILVVIGWGVVFVLTYNTSEYLMKRANFKHWIFADLVSSAWGLVFEWFGHVFFKTWEYNDVFGQEGFMGIPWAIFFAWPGMVVLFNHFMRNYDTIIETRLSQVRVTSD